MRTRVGERSGFASLSREQQSDDHAQRSSTTPFFAVARSLVVIGTFADPSYGGNRGGAGWKMVGIEHRSSYAAPFGWYDAQTRHAPTHARMNQRTYSETRHGRFRHRRVRRRGRSVREGARRRRDSTSSCSSRDRGNSRAQFTHDELAVEREFDDAEPRVRADSDVSNDGGGTARAGTPARMLRYRRGVGGSSVHFTANYWRFRPIDFRERRCLGSIGGTGFADWPITYEELEPYYTKVDWEIGVSGAPGPFDPPRSRGYPLPPLPNKSSGVLLERARERSVCTRRSRRWRFSRSRTTVARHAWRADTATTTAASSARSRRRSSTVIPKAVATGRCEIRTDSTVFRVETNAKGRTTGVVYWDRDGTRAAPAARAVILAANGAETTRLLLMSTSPAFPHGLANSSGNVGRYIMFNGAPNTFGRFEHPLNEYKGAVVEPHRFTTSTTSDPKRGFYGGGGIDARFPLQSDRVRASNMLAGGRAAVGQRVQARAARLLHALGAIHWRTSRRCRWRRTPCRSIPTIRDRWDVPGSA